MEARAQDARAQDAYKALARLDYGAYVDYVHEGAWRPTRAGRYLCREVQAYLEADTGRAYDILVIQMPPQHGKSMTITKTLPSWCMGKRPWDCTIMLSYNDNYAQEYGRANLRKAQRYGSEIFGLRLARDVCRAGHFESEAGGVVYSAGVQAGVTGRSAHLLLIDDPIKNRMEADSETYRERIWREWQDSYRTRLAPGAKVILIQTRWHEDDLAGRLISREPHTRVINLPCEAEEGDPLGRAVGEPLCPELGRGERWLADLKAAVLAGEGSRTWHALYQGRPSSERGNLILRHWWQYYQDLPALDFELISVDASFKGGTDNDYVAIQGWGRLGSKLYLTDYIKAHMGFAQTLEAIRAMRVRRPRARMILVEDKANGSAIIEMLKKEVPGVVAVTPEGGKVARVNAVSYAIEAGDVLLPKYQIFSEDLVEEAAAFPLGAHDDAVDAMSQGLNRLLHIPGDGTGPRDEDEGEDPDMDLYHFGG